MGLCLYIYSRIVPKPLNLQLCKWGLHKGSRFLEFHLLQEIPRQCEEVFSIPYLLCDTAGQYGNQFESEILNIAFSCKKVSVK